MIDTPAIKFFYMIAATAIGGSVRHILEYAKTNHLASDRVAQVLTAELLFAASCVARPAHFTREDLHNLLDEMADEAAEGDGASH